jgi:hypothetical protein
VPEIKGITQLQDVTGKVVAQQPVTGTVTIYNLTYLPRGLYFAVWTNGRSSTVSQKVVVE